MSENEERSPLFNLTRDEARKVMEENPPTVNYVDRFQILMGWSWKGCGFGELWIRYDEKTGKFEADTETMSRESVRKFLHALADHIADKMEFP